MTSKSETARAAAMAATGKFFSEAGSDAENKPEEPARGRPKKTETDKKRGYRYNLNLDRDLEPYLREAAWKRRTSITQYINDLIRADMTAASGPEKES